TTFGVVITVNAAAPFGLTYPTPMVFTENIIITDVVPTVSGTGITFSISPSLPAGLSFDAATGMISGTPTDESPETVYTVTATNSGGSVTFEVTITVEPELGTGDHDQLVFSVYPNPFEDHVMVSGISGSATFSLIAIDGKLIQKGIVEGNIIRFGGLPQGVFVLSVTSQDGKSGMRKIVRK
ncbi:putative Ig domain-containing protein, partial [Flavobacterium selenitireducens]|uniref:putative Ig domain-containing protein n=1 Tax=Flavobacterium selenitireducens TaxID=2722704 RepID=UPI00168B8175